MLLGKRVRSIKVHKFWNKSIISFIAHELTSLLYWAIFCSRSLFHSFTHFYYHRSLHGKDVRRKEIERKRKKTCLSFKCWSNIWHTWMNRCWRLAFRKVIFHRLPLNKQCDLTHSLTFFRIRSGKNISVAIEPQLIHLIHIGTGYEQNKRFENAFAQICTDSIDLFLFSRDLLWGKKCTMDEKKKFCCYKPQNSNH